jgi:hypothetical protein
LTESMSDATSSTCTSRSCKMHRPRFRWTRLTRSFRCRTDANTGSASAPLASLRARSDMLPCLARRPLRVHRLLESLLADVSLTDKSVNLTQSDVSLTCRSMMRAGPDVSQTWAIYGATAMWNGSGTSARVGACGLTGDTGSGLCSRPSPAPRAAQEHRSSPFSARHRVRAKIRDQIQRAPRSGRWKRPSGSRATTASTATTTTSRLRSARSRSRPT